MLTNEEFEIRIEQKKRRKENKLRAYDNYFVPNASKKRIKRNKSKKRSTKKKNKCCCTI